MEAAKFPALAVCLTLCVVGSLSGKVSGKNGKMCGAIVTAGDGGDRSSLTKKAFAAFRGECRRADGTSMPPPQTKPAATTEGKYWLFSILSTFSSIYQ